MYIGLDGTVGSQESLLRAIREVGALRLSGIWRELNAPINLAGKTNAPGVTAVGQTVGSLAGTVARATPVGMVPGSPLPKIAETAAGGAARYGLSAIVATLEQIKKLRAAAGMGSVSDIQNTDETVAMERLAMVKWGFIHQMFEQFAGHNFYFQGPTTLGSEDGSIIAGATSTVLSHRSKLPGEPLIIAGYSRGGLNALETARRLSKHDIAVDLLILLDPVDRDVNTPSEGTVPPNVKQIILIGRSGYLKYTAFTHELNVFSLKVSIPDLRIETQSRWWFGRLVTSDDLKDFTKPMTAEYDCTHAAHGGLPWQGDHPPFLSEAADREGAKTVAKTLSVFIRLAGTTDSRIRLGAPITLRMT